MGQWGTVCMNGFDISDVIVVCKILQYYKNDRYKKINIASVLLLLVHQHRSKLAEFS